MRGVMGPYGNINQDGKPWSAAELFNNRLPDILEDVEEGIRPVVRAAIARGLDTASSCAGHHYPPELGNGETARSIDFIIDAARLPDWQAFMIKLITDTHAPYLHRPLEGRPHNTICNYPYESPLRFNVFWSIHDAALANQMTDWLAAAIERGEHPPAL